MQDRLVAVAYVDVNKIQRFSLQTWAYANGKRLKHPVKIISSKQSSSHLFWVPFFLELNNFKQILQFWIHWKLILNADWLLAWRTVTHVGNRANSWRLRYKPEQGESQWALRAKKILSFSGFQRFEELTAKCVKTKLLDRFPDRLSVINNPLAMNTSLRDIKEGFQHNHEITGYQPPDEQS